MRAGRRRQTGSAPRCTQCRTLLISSLAPESLCSRHARTAAPCNKFFSPPTSCAALLRILTHESSGDSCVQSQSECSASCL